MEKHSVKVVISHLSPAINNSRYCISVLVLIWFSFSTINVAFSKTICANSWHLEFVVVTILLLQYVIGSLPFLLIKMLRHPSTGFGDVSLDKTDFLVGFFYLTGNAGALISLAYTSVSVNQG